MARSDPPKPRVETGAREDLGRIEALLKASVPRRILTTEPFLRQAVPVLMTLFILTFGAAVFVNLRERWRETIANATRELDQIATIVADRLDRTAANGDGDAIVRTFHAFQRGDWEWATTAGRMLLITDASGTIIETQPVAKGYIGRNFEDVFGLSSNDRARATQPRILEIRLPDGSDTLLALRRLNTSPAQLVITQPLTFLLHDWRAGVVLLSTLYVATSFVILMTCFAFLWQSRILRETASIEDAVHNRIDTALISGRCGLWDWDISSGRLFWSRSMFEILEFHSSTSLRTLDDVETLFHPSDTDPKKWPAELMAAGADFIERTFRMRHARRGWVWVRARLKLVSGTATADAHLVGIVVEIDNQRHFATVSSLDQLRHRDVKLQSLTPTEGPEEVEPSTILQGDETISKEKNSSNQNFVESTPPFFPYPASLVRFFAAGALLAALGLVMVVFGLATTNFSKQFAGSAFLALGLVLITLTVMRAEVLQSHPSQ